MKIKLLLGTALIFLLIFSSCIPPKITPRPSPKPSPNAGTKPSSGTPIDTVRWSENNAGKPPITSKPNGGNKPNDAGQSSGNFSNQKFRIALLMPLLTQQMDAAPGGVPEKSAKAIHFYAGAKLALQQLSEMDGMNLVVDVYDTQLNDADFSVLLKNPKLGLADVFVGPFRSSHIQMLAKSGLAERKIVVSPESPNEKLVSKMPGFLQLNPSLRAHCEAILRYIRRKSPTAQVVLVARERETDRLEWLQQLNAQLGGARLPEIVLPDATTNLTKTDLKPYFQVGRKTIFVVPSFSSQDFVFAVFRQVRSQMGKNEVEIFGMPQWQDFENIEPDYFQKLNVHITASTFTDFSVPAAKTFAELFLLNYQTVPSDDAFRGYDATMFVGKMLQRYALSFPEKSVGQTWRGISTNIMMGKIAAGGTFSENTTQPEYLENRHLHILKFQDFKFRLAE